jgi:hypothetical protein
VAETAGAPHRDSEQLFDLMFDPNETRNVVADPAERTSTGTVVSTAGCAASPDSGPIAAPKETTHPMVFP